MSWKVIRTMEGSSFISVLDSMLSSFLKNLALTCLHPIMQVHSPQRKNRLIHPAQTNILLVHVSPFSSHPFSSHSFILSQQSLQVFFLCTEFTYNPLLLSDFCPQPSFKTIIKDIQITKFNGNFAFFIFQYTLPLLTLLMAFSFSNTPIISLSFVFTSVFFMIPYNPVTFNSWYCINTALFCCVQYPWVMESTLLVTTITSQ